MWILVLQRIGLEFLRDIISFPVWWYTAGVKQAALLCVDFFQLGNQVIAPVLWLRNLLVPMFGQTDWQGRIVSFFIRLVNIFVRVGLVCVWAVIVAFIFALWCIAPAAIIFFLLRSLR